MLIKLDDYRGVPSILQQRQERERHIMEEVMKMYGHLPSGLLACESAHKVLEEGGTRTEALQAARDVLLVKGDIDDMQNFSMEMFNSLKANRRVTDLVNQRNHADAALLAHKYQCVKCSNLSTYDISLGLCDLGKALADDSIKQNEKVKFQR